MPHRKIDPDTDRVLQAIRGIIRLVAVNSRHLATSHGITGPQLSALYALNRKGDLTGTEIADRLLLSPSTVVGVIDRLEEKCLVARKRDKEDRRRVLVSLTQAGKDLVKEVPHPIEGGLTRLLSQMPSKEKEQMADSLEACAAMLGVDGEVPPELDDLDLHTDA